MGFFFSKFVIFIFNLNFFTKRAMQLEDFASVSMPEIRLRVKSSNAWRDLESLASI